MSFPRRGEIYLVDFDPTRGHEIKKTRPALVIQNDVGNRYSQLTIVAAISSKLSEVPFPVEVILKPNKENGLVVASAIHLEQIRSVDCSRLVKKLGRLDQATLSLVEDALKISLGLTSAGTFTS